MAEFCLTFGLSPETYRSLTLMEYRAFVEAFNRRADA